MYNHMILTYVCHLVYAELQQKLYNLQEIKCSNWDEDETYLTCLNPKPNESCLLLLTVRMQNFQL